MGQRDFLKIRADARARGDYSLVHAMTVELERLGYREPVDEEFETTVVTLADRPTIQRGRPKLPRCEHGKIVGRCVECDEDLAA